MFSSVAEKVNDTWRQIQFGQKSPKEELKGASLGLTVLLLKNAGELRKRQLAPDGPEAFLWQQTRALFQLEQQTFPVLFWMMEDASLPKQRS